MRQHIAIATIAFGLSATLMAPPARAQNLPPCAEIRAACEQAGFVQGAVRDGYGLQIDCIRPILEGLPQRPRATMPLPPVDPRIVAACRQRMAGGPAGRPNVAAAGVPPCGPDQPPLPQRAPHQPAEPDQSPQHQDQPGQSPPQPEPQQ